MSNQAAKSFLLFQLKVYSMVGAVLLLWACSESIPSQSHSQSDALEIDPVSYSVLVKFKDATAATDGRAVQRLRAAGLIRPQQLGLVPGLTRSSLRRSQDLQKTLADLEKQPNIEYAEPDYAVWPLAIPNDSRFSELEGLNNTGQAGGRIDADIDAPEAWDLQTGNDIVIAVIDSGVDYLHPDLKDNIWVNVNEIPGNGIDDDGNGFIDDVNGWNFVNNSNDPMDQRDHGTHVAGTLAAVGDNQAGITGVNWRAKIMPLKFIDDQGIGSVSRAIAALEYAVANGARISNNSWGGGKFSQAMYDALSAANAAGHLFVVGAGNDAKDNDRFPHYPSSYDLNNVIAVVATDNRDQLAALSNYGVRSTDLAAPGMAILSTAKNNRYQVLSGSSIAAPFVSGVAGLILSQNAHLTISDIRSTLLNAVDKQDSLVGKVASGGRINAFKAVSSVPMSSSIVLVTPMELSPNNLELPVGASQTLTASGGLAPLIWSVDNPNVAKINPNTGIIVGLSEGAAQIAATDANGVTASLAVVVKAAAALSLSPAGTQMLGVDGQLNYTVQGGQAPYRWSSSNTSIASIDISSAGTEAAVLSANALGTARIGVVDASGAYLVVKVKVIDPSVSLLAIVPNQVTLTVNETRTLTATGGGPTYSWASSNINVARVGATTGIVTAVSVGAATIIVSSNGITDPNTANVTVQAAASTPPAPGPGPAPAPGPGAITVRSPANTVSVGQTLQFTASGGTPPYTWTVTNNLISSINASGLLSIPATIPFGGQMNVIATDANNVVGRSGSISVTAAAGTAPPTPPGGTPLPPGTTPPGTTPTPGPAPTPTPAPVPAPAPAAGGGGGGGGMGGGGMGGGM